jgi:hypothetical protein
MAPESKTFKEDVVLSDPAASYWLKEQIKTTRGRDSVDVMNDLEILKKLIHERIECHNRP